MGNEQNKPPVQAQPGKAVGDVSNLAFSDAQVARIERAIIYGAVASGVIFSKPGLTPSPANLKIIKDLADTVEKLLHG